VTPDNWLPLVAVYPEVHWQALGLAALNSARIVFDIFSEL
jgi:hypothetical protein